MMDQTDEAGTLPGVCKYVRFADGFFVVFPMTNGNNQAAHDRMARTYSRSRPISAGMFIIAKSKVITEGRSETLNLDRLPDDAELLSNGLGIGQ